MDIKRAGTRQTDPGSADYFTGAVRDTPGDFVDNATRESARFLRHLRDLNTMRA